MVLVGKRQIDTTNEVNIELQGTLFQVQPSILCKLWKLQYEPHDIDPRGHLSEVKFAKLFFANHLSHLTNQFPTSHERPLDQYCVTHIKVCTKG